MQSPVMGSDLTTFATGGSGTTGGVGGGSELGAFGEGPIPPPVWEIRSGHPIRWAARAGSLHRWRYLALGAFATGGSRTTGGVGLGAFGDSTLGSTGGGLGAFAGVELGGGLGAFADGALDMKSDILACFFNFGCSTPSAFAGVELGGGGLGEDCAFAGVDLGGGGLGEDCAFAGVELGGGLG